MSKEQTERKMSRWLKAKSLQMFVCIECDGDIPQGDEFYLVHRRCISRLWDVIDKAGIEIPNKTTAVAIEVSDDGKDWSGKFKVVNGDKPPSQKIIDEIVKDSKFYRIVYEKEFPPYDVGEPVEVKHENTANK